MNYQNLMPLTSSDTKRTLMHLLLFTNSAQKELVSKCTQSIHNRNWLSLPYILGYDNHELASATGSFFEVLSCLRQWFCLTAIWYTESLLYLLVVIVKITLKYHRNSLQMMKYHRNSLQMMKYHRNSLQIMK